MHRSPWSGPSRRCCVVMRCPTPFAAPAGEYVAHYVRSRRRELTVDEATIEDGVPTTAGWFVINARDARWMHNDMRAVCKFGGEGPAHFDESGDRPVLDRAGQADDALPPRGRAGGLPRPARRLRPGHRGRGADAGRVGLRPLPARHRAHDRRRRRRARSHPRRRSPQGAGQRALPVRAGRGPPRRRSTGCADLGARPLRDVRHAASRDPRPGSEAPSRRAQRSSR